MRREFPIGFGLSFRRATAMRPPLQGSGCFGMATQGDALGWYDDAPLGRGKAVSPPIQPGLSL